MAAIPQRRTSPALGILPVARRGNQHLITEHQRRYAETLPGRRFDVVDSSHFIQAEQPKIIADWVRRLLDQAGRPGAPGPIDGPARSAQSTGQLRRR